MWFTERFHTKLNGVLLPLKRTDFSRRAKWSFKLRDITRVIPNGIQTSFVSRQEPDFTSRRGAWILTAPLCSQFSSVQKKKKTYVKMCICPSGRCWWVFFTTIYRLDDECINLTNNQHIKGALIDWFFLRLNKLNNQTLFVFMTE